MSCSSFTPGSSSMCDMQKTQSELAAEEVMEAKQYLVELDRRQNQFRTAKRALIKAVDPIQPLWILSGASTFVASDLSTSGTIDYFARRMEEGERCIAAARDDLKRKVAALASLESPESALAELYKGFDLNKV